MKKFINSKVGTLTLITLSLLLFLFIIVYSYNNYNEPTSEDILEEQKEELLSRIPEDEIMKQDILEGILEFADEYTPIDSLYIPNWLFE